MNARGGSPREVGGVGAAPAGPAAAPGASAPERDVHRADPISLRAQRVALITSLATRVRTLGRRLWIIPIIALALVIVDAAVGLPAWARAMLGIAAIATAVWAVMAFVFPGRGARLSVLGAARVLEERLGLRDNALVNALQLRTALASDNGITATLAERAVDRGVEIVRTRDGGHVVDTRGITRVWIGTVVVTALVAASALLIPRVWEAGVPRYVDPFGDHPAWSPTGFEVEVSPREVLAGDDATVIVRLSGVIPPGVELVFVDGDGRTIDHAAMGAASGAVRAGVGLAERTGLATGATETSLAREYRLTLHDLREPVRFYPMAETGRGAVGEIVVLDRPRVRAATLVVRPPDYAGMAPTSERLDLGEKEITRRVLEGTTVELSVESSVEIGSVKRAEGSAPADVDIAGRTATARVRAAKAGDVALAVRPVSRSGLASDEGVGVGLEVVSDAPPRVSVRAPAEPGGRAAVLEGAGVPIRAVAEDDVRVASLEAEWRVTRLGGDESGSADEGPSERSPLRVERVMRTRWDGQLVLDTGSMGLRAGDEIELWISATDDRGDTFGGAQETRVGPIGVSVIDQQEFKRRTLERMGIEDVVGPYEDIARRAGELARAAREAADAAARAERGEGNGQEAARAARQAEAKREALERAVERRLGGEAMVDFDESMRPGLENLRDRLEEMKESAGAQGQPGVQAQERAGRTSDRGKESASDEASRQAEMAELAAREAALDVAQPAEKLRLAAEMRAELDRLDRIAKAQRALADRLAGMQKAQPGLDPAEAASLTREQHELMEHTDEVCARLDALGDRAANELPGAAALDGAEMDLTRARRAAQEAIELARDRADAPGSGVADPLMRAQMRDAADLALTDLYFASDPALDAVRKAQEAVDEHGARLDDPDVAKAAAEGRERIRKALEAVDQIETLLNDVRRHAKRTNARQTTQRDREWSPLLVAAVLGAGLQDGAPAAIDAGDGTGDDTLSLDSGFVRALQAARLRLGELKARLREAEAAMSAPLPTMGASAIGLAQRVEDAEIAPTMYDAESAMEEGDLTEAGARATEAAERLEALYEEVSGEPGQCKGSDDAPLQLLRGAPSSQSRSGSSGASGSSGGSSGTSVGSADGQGGQAGGASEGLPNALDVVSKSGAGGGAARGSDQAGSDKKDGAGQDPSDRGGFSRAGAPGKAGGSGRGGAGQNGPSAPGSEPQGDSRGGEGQQDGAGADPRNADRARRFNEKLYGDPVEMNKPLEGESAGVRTEADVIHLEGSEAERANGVRGALARSGMSAPEVEAVFERVPPAYRDVVAAYLMRIARDEAAEAGGVAEQAAPASEPVRRP